MIDPLKNKLYFLGAPKDAEAQLGVYSALLRRANEKFNLTAITDEREIEEKHFFDSLAAAPLLNAGETVIDVGSGAGFPGLVLAVARPDVEFRLIDSVNKKVAFMNMVITELGLKNASAVHTRVEDICKTFLYDVAIARAVAELRVLAEYTLPFIKIGGRFIAYKSQKTEEEIDAAENALSVLGGKIEEVVDVESVDGSVRKLVIVRKISETPPRFPRGRNFPRTKPL